MVRPAVAGALHPSPRMVEADDPPFGCLEGMDAPPDADWNRLRAAFAGRSGPELIGARTAQPSESSIDSA